MIQIYCYFSNKSRSKWLKPRWC